MSFERIIAPAAEPLDVATARTWAKVSSAHDTIIGDILIPSARQLAESITQRSLITQTWLARFDAWPEAEDVELWWGPVRSISSVQYLDNNGTLQTLDSSLYTLEKPVEPCYVLRAYGVTWPSTLDAANAIRITYTAGYGDSASDVPHLIRQWMLLKITAALENPSALDATGRVGVLPNRALDEMLDPYIVHKGD